MNQHHTIHLLSWARLVGLALLLGVGLLTSLGLATRTAHAQPSATIIVSTCDETTLRSAINNAASGDTITFGCSGTITLGSTLDIEKNLTLDGSGQQVTLSGGGSVEVLFVNSVSFTLKALTIAHGSGDNGGGLFSEFGTLSISNSTFANNSATGAGGGILNQGGTVSINNSTFAGNSAFSDGGGLFNGGGSTVSISNSTFANNSAAFEGGGIENFGTVSITQSIVVGNTPNDCFGGVSDQGYNLEGAFSCGFTGTGSLQNTDPKLDPGGLQNNGGPTQTIALLATSPAIDHIPAANCPATDQRGVTRLPGERCDIGAFEFPDTTPPTLHLPSPITVNATSPQGAVVSYRATATDDDGDALTATCAPASGSTFPIGTTTVNCSASEPGSNTATGSFSVTVNGAATQVNNLITTVNSMGLSSGLQNSLDVKLNAALKAVKAGQTATACSDLSDFIGEAQSQSGKGLTVSQTNQLIAAATQVQAVLGC